jgi:hypothetical protein
MDSAILVALLSFSGTLIGSVAGIIASSKMTAFRLEQLEKKVEKHNCLVERMVAVEQSTKSAHHRIDELCE